MFVLNVTLSVLLVVTSLIKEAITMLTFVWNVLSGSHVKVCKLIDMNKIYTDDYLLGCALSQIILTSSIYGFVTSARNLNVVWNNKGKCQTTLHTKIVPN